MGKYKLKVEEDCQSSGVLSKSTEYEMKIYVSGDDQDDVERLAISAESHMSPRFRSRNNFRGGK